MLLHLVSSDSFSSERLSRRRSGFTLVELLVVIGIIIILMSVLLPVLNSVRASSRQTKCSDQLAHLGKIFKKKQAAVGTRLRPENIETYFAEELEGNEAVWNCPDVVSAEASYGWNGRVGRISEADGTKKIVALDYDKVKADVIGPDAPVEEFKQYVGARHFGETNVLFADLHVESRDPTLIDPAICYFHEKYWRPETDIRNTRQTEPGCDTPPSGTNIGGPEAPGEEEEDPNEPEPDPCEISPQISDESGAVFIGTADEEGMVQAWQESTGGYGGTHQVADVTGYNVRAQYTVTGLQPIHSVYEIMVTWVPDATNNTSNAIFEVYDGGTTEVLVDTFDGIDMKEMPNDDLVLNGINFQVLSDEIEIKNGGITILVKGSGSGNVVADAIRIGCPGDRNTDTGGGNNGGGEEEEDPENPNKKLLHYEFNTQGNEGYDSSPEDNHGWNIGAAWMECSGAGGGAMMFSGATDFVEVPDFTMGGDITIAAWVKVEDKTDADGGAIISLGTGADRIALFTGPITQGNATAHAYFTASGVTKVLSDAIDVGVWTHLRVTVEGTQYSVYKNNSSSPEIQESGPTITSRSRTNQMIGQSLTGLVDDVQIYDTATELDSVGDEPDGCELSLHIYYPFDDEIRPYKNEDDFSGIGYDGIPFGSPLVWCNPSNPAQDGGYLDMDGSGSVSFERTRLVGDGSAMAMAWVKFPTAMVVEAANGGSNFNVQGPTNSLHPNHVNRWQQTSEGFQVLYPRNTLNRPHTTGGLALDIPLFTNYNGGAAEGQWVEFEFTVPEYGTHAVYARWPESISVPPGPDPLTDVNEPDTFYHSLDGGTLSVPTKMSQAIASSNTEGNAHVPATYKFVHDANVQVNPLRVRVYRQSNNSVGLLCADAVLVLPNFSGGSDPGGPILGTGSGSGLFDVGIRPSPTVSGTYEAYCNVGGSVAFAPLGDPNSNGWYHVAGAYDSSSGEATVYVNGSAASGPNNPAPAVADFTDATFTVGRAAGVNFVGTMDEFHFYTKADESYVQDAANSDPSTCQ